MERKLIQIKIDDYPLWTHELLKDAQIYDSSCSPEARVIFIDKNEGFYLKKAPKGSLFQEKTMTEFFHSKGLAAEVLGYESKNDDWLLTRKVQGEDCTFKKYIDQPKKLCDTIATILRHLHEIDAANCPVDRVKSYIETVERNYKKNHFDNNLTDTTIKLTKDDAYDIFCENKQLLHSEVLIHGDYCLPNIMLNNFRFSAFIDLGNAGIGDRHIDLFWGEWTLRFNLGTNEYSERFFDAYGREKVEKEKLKIIAAMECFG